MAWEAQLVKLVAYKAEHSHCGVPKIYAEDKPLGEWVNKQRKLKRKLDRDEPCEGMTAARAARLTALSFVWDPANVAWEAQLVKLMAYKARHVLVLRRRVLGLRRRSAPGARLLSMTLWLRACDSNKELFETGFTTV